MSEDLFYLCDDTHNDPGVDQFDLSDLSPKILRKLDEASLNDAYGELMQRNAEAAAS